MKADSTVSDWSADGDSDRAASPAPRRPGLSPSRAHLLKPVPRPRGGVHHRVIQIDPDTFVV